MWTETPLLIAANRDELYSRPASPPRIQVMEGAHALAPVDDRAGGTWIGLNDHGVLAAITNRRGQDQDASRQSRGGLVFEALRGRTASEGLSRVQGLSADAFNGYHLAVADRSEAGVVWSDGRATTRQPLPPGLHVVTEGSFRDRPCARAAWIAGDPMGWAQLTDPPAMEALRALLATRQDPMPVSVAAPGIGYGTRSSSIIRLGPEVDDVRWHEASGPPHATPFVSQGPLLDQLFA